jgi:hypothetical protein
VLVQRVLERPRHPNLEVLGSVDYARQLGRGHRVGAHGARLKRDDQRQPVEPPAAEVPGPRPRVVRGSGPPAPTRRWRWDLNPRRGCFLIRFRSVRPRPLRDSPPARTLEAVRHRDDQLADVFPSHPGGTEQDRSQGERFLTLGGAARAPPGIRRPGRHPWPQPVPTPLFPPAMTQVCHSHRRRRPVNGRPTRAIRPNW